MVRYRIVGKNQVPRGILERSPFHLKQELIRQSRKRQPGIRKYGYSTREMEQGKDESGKG